MYTTRYQVHPHPLLAFWLFPSIFHHLAGYSFLPRSSFCFVFTLACSTLHVVPRYFRSDLIAYSYITLVMQAPRVWKIYLLNIRVRISRLSLCSFTVRYALFVFYNTNIVNLRSLMNFIRVLILNESNFGLHNKYVFWKNLKNKNEQNFLHAFVSVDRCHIPSRFWRHCPSLPFYFVTVLFHKNSRSAISPLIFLFPRFFSSCFLFLLTLSTSRCNSGRATGI